MYFQLKEFAIQSNRLKEFRITIKKLEDNLTEIVKLQNFFDKDLSSINGKTIETKIDNLTNIAPRLQGVKNISKYKSKRF